MCLVGRNGSGKSTLLKIAAGLVEPDRGSIFLQPDATVRYLPQEPDLSGFATVGGLCRGGAWSRATTAMPRAICWSSSACAAMKTARRCRAARRAAPRSPGCWRRRPIILLLDEPTNHLDLPAIEWLERELDGAPGGARHHQP